MAKKRKHVSLPRSYNPPGRNTPPETLAYLTKDEHDFIRRATDGRHSKGPKGVKSYAMFAGTSGTGYSSAANSTSKMGSGTGNSGAGGSASKSSSTGSSAAKSSSSGSVASSKGPGASQAAAKASTSSSQSKANNSPGTSNNTPASTSAFGGSPSRNSALGQAAAAAQSAAVKASPAYSGSSSQNAARAAAVSRGPGVISGALPGSTNALAQKQTSTALRNSIAENPAFGRSYTSRAFGMMPKAVIGEAMNEGDIGRAAVANVMMNRLSLGINNPAAFGYLGAGSIPKMMRGIDAAGVDPNRPQLTPNSGYRTTVPGTANYADGLRAVADSMSPYSEFSKTATPRTLAATHYYNPAISNPPWGQKRSGTPFDTVGNHVFGNAENTQSMVAGLRGASVPGTQIASNAPDAAAEAARMQRNAQALQTLGGALQGSGPLGPYQGPRMPNDPNMPRNIPAPQSMGMLAPAPRPTARPPMQGPPRPSVMNDPRVGMSPGAFPAARMQSPVMGDPRVGMPTGAFPQARMQSPVMGDPRVGMPSGAFPAAPKPPTMGSDGRVGLPPGAFPGARPPSVVNDPRVGLPQGGFPPERPSSVVNDPRVGLPQGGFPPAKPASIFSDPRVGLPTGGFPKAKPVSIVATDPRVNMKPGSYPAAQKPIQVAWNTPPMGGALPADIGTALGVWSTTRPTPAAPHEGTIHSRTADNTPPAEPSGGSFFNAAYNTAADAVNTVKEKKQQIDQTVKDVEKQYGPITEGKVKLALALLGSGSPATPAKFGGNPGNFGSLPSSPQTAMASAGAPPRQLASAAPDLNALLANMTAQGATPEEIAFVQMLIEQQTARA